ncbi:MAG: amidohydrolase family protein [Pirellulales bacterium]
MNRRSFLACSTATLAAWQLPHIAQASACYALPDRMIDTHQHLWDLKTIYPSWLKGSSLLEKKFHLEEYAEATQGLPIQSIYMEVDVDDKDLDIEAAHVLGLCEQRKGLMAAVLGGRPNHPQFSAYLDRWRGRREFKGVRRVLHSDKTPAGFCLHPEFVKGIQELGKRDLHFELCMRPNELTDGATLAKQCPETRFMVDHCGNANPEWYQREAAETAVKEANQWKRSIDVLASLPNVYCKISGIIARLKPNGEIAPIINHCLDAFGPDRVVFGSDWPVCLSGATLRVWVDRLVAIIADRSQESQRKLWAENAIRFYRIG